MNAYPFIQKDLRNGKERRKSRIPVGITFELIDRRKDNGASYTGSEKRSGKERRGKIWDRRKPKIPCYSTLKSPH
jgi:hypothetical protein